MLVVKNLSLWRKLRLLAIIYLRKFGLIRLSYFVVTGEDNERIQELVRGQSPLTKMNFHYGGKWNSKPTYINYQKAEVASGKPVVRMWLETESGQVVTHPFVIKLKNRYVWFFKKDETNIYTSFLED